MKKKTWSIALIIAFVMTMLAILIVKFCMNPSAEKVIKEYEKNLNNLNASALTKQFDVKKYNKLVNGNYKKDDIEKAYEESLHDKEKGWIKVQDITTVKSAKDIGFGNLAYIDGEVLEKCLDKYEVYLLDIEVEGKKGQDFVVINHGKIVYNVIISVILKDVPLLNKFNEFDGLDNSAYQFNKPFYGYEGKKRGSSVKELLNKVITSNTENQDNVDRLLMILYIQDGGAYPNTRIIPTDTDIKTENILELIDNIEDYHYYNVQFQYSSDNFLDGIAITYDSQNVDNVFKAEYLINEYAENMNNFDYEKLTNQTDIDNVNELLEENLNSEDIEEAYETFCSFFHGDWYEVVDYKKIMNTDEIIEHGLSYNEDILEKCFDKYEVYLINVKSHGLDGFDYIVINDGKMAYNLVMNYNFMPEAEEDTLDELEIQLFNEIFESYEGRQIGTGVKVLLNKIITSNTQNSGMPDRLPIVIYKKGDGNYSDITIIPDETNAKTQDITELRDHIANSHYYIVQFHYSSKGLINGVAIGYNSNDTSDMFEDIDW